MSSVQVPVLSIQRRSSATRPDRVRYGVAGASRLKPNWFPQVMSTASTLAHSAAAVTPAHHPAHRLHLFHHHLHVLVRPLLFVLARRLFGILHHLLHAFEAAMHLIGVGRLLRIGGSSERKQRNDGKGSMELHGLSLLLGLLRGTVHLNA